MITDKNIEYTNDEPINYPEQDRLGREELVNNLSKIIKGKFGEYKNNKKIKDKKLMEVTIYLF